MNDPSMPEEVRIRERLHAWRRTGTYYRGQNWSGERAMAYDIDRLLEIGRAHV